MTLITGDRVVVRFSEADVGEGEEAEVIEVISENKFHLRFDNGETWWYSDMDQLEGL